MSFTLNFLDLFLIVVIAGLLAWLIWLKQTENKTQQERARALFESWKEREYESLKDDLNKLAMEQAQLRLAGESQALRADAIKRSTAVTLGKASEQLAPYLPGFIYQPADARFLGSPIDLIIFDGLSEGNLREIIFLEIKTGQRPSLSDREKQVQDCLLKKAVRHQILNLKAQ
ncbi:MAG: Holliday junction resolvase-like protein [Candidatus Caenarcaniphilales bacterium]|nr:Holliday junction resolvase-like protein [Candidatus Caenarcaniphilales bacterium]